MSMLVCLCVSLYVSLHLYDGHYICVSSFSLSLSLWACLYDRGLVSVCFSIYKWMLVFVCVCQDISACLYASTRQKTKSSWRITIDWQLYERRTWKRRKEQNNWCRLIDTKESPGILSRKQERIVRHFFFLSLEYPFKNFS